MKNIFRSFISIIPFLCLSGGIRAQSLGISYLGISDTVYNYTDYLLKIGVQNKGNAAFNGNFYLYQMVNNNQAVILDTVLSVSMQPADTTIYSDSSYEYNPVKGFVPGINIVVVWPTDGAGVVPTADSAVTSVYVIDISGLNEFKKRETILISPNPASREFIIASPDRNIDRVRILDMAGRELFRTSLTRNSVDVASLVQGVYFIEIHEKGGHTSMQKMIKE